MPDGPDWGTLVAGAEPTRRFDKDEVKEALPLEWVLLREGILLEPAQDGRLVGPCPFHQDADPSFAVFGDRHEKAGCWVCDFQTGDIFDVLARLHGLDFRASLQLAGRHLDEFRKDEGWRPMAGTAVPRPKADPADLGREVQESWAMLMADQSAVQRLIHEKQQTDPG